MDKQINITVDENDKKTFIEACKKRDVKMKEVFLALVDSWLSMPDVDAVNVVFDYKRRQINRLNEAMRNRAPVIGETHQRINPDTGKLEDVE